MTTPNENLGNFLFSILLRFGMLAVRWPTAIPASTVKPFVKGRCLKKAFICNEVNAWRVRV